MTEHITRQLIGIVSTPATIDWLIVHRLVTIIDFDYTCLDIGPGRRHAYGACQGFISLKSIDLVIFEEVIATATTALQDHLIGLAHIFIIIQRQSVEGDQSAAAFYKRDMITGFKARIGNLQCEALFNLMIESLNKDYYAASRQTYKQDPTVAEWLQYFAWSGNHGYDCFGPRHAVRLLQEDGSLEWQYHWTILLSPFLRSIAFAAWPSPLLLTAEQAIAVIHSKPGESRFLAALLLFMSNRERCYTAGWSDQAIVNAWIQDQWEAVGRDFLLFTFGQTNRIRQDDPHIAELRKMVLLAMQTIPPAALGGLIAGARFPMDFISMAQLLDKADITLLPAFKKAIVLEFLKEVRVKLSDSLQNLEGSMSSDPFSFYESANPAYRHLLSNISYWMVQHLDKEIGKQFVALVHMGARQYLGRYNSIHLANKCTEILLVCLLASNKEAFTLEIENNLRKLATPVIEYLLVAYVHHTEAINTVWNYKNQQEWILTSTKWIMELLSHVLHHAEKGRYQMILDAFEQTKLCPWPYEEMHVVFVDP